MRWHLLLLVGGLAPLAGCHLAETALHNTVNEPAMYLDEKHVTHECRAEGRRVAKELRCRQAMSEDYEDGFVDGFADALERGGDPVPPAVPPTKYRRGRFLTANGHARIHDYFAGFQQGATCATASGQRQFLTVPVLLADPPPEQLPPVQQIPKEQCAPDSTPPKVVSSLPAAAAPKPEPTETTLLPPARPLIGAPPKPPVIPPPAPEVKADLPAIELTPEGVVPARPEPRVVVPPK